MPPLSKHLKQSGVEGKLSLKGKAPLWQGPSSPEDNGGITFSMLSRFLNCRERFRVHYVEGLRTQDQFNHRIEYGQMWHVCEEALAKADSKYRGHWQSPWEPELLSYSQALGRQYPLHVDQVGHWYHVCKAQFPLYKKYWAEHPDQVKRTPLLQEHVFDELYTLPSGRAVRLRGKWDSVDLVDGGIWLQENKTKGDIDPLQIQRQLTFDLQTMIYMTALRQYAINHQLRDTARKKGAGASVPLAGVRYNVVRRPLSGGKGSIVRHKATDGSKCPRCKNVSPTSKHCLKCKGTGRVGSKQEETKESYYKRVASYIEEAPQDFFFRWNTPITTEDINTFRKRCLDPLLEQLCDWWDWVGTLAQDPFDTKGSGGVHWQHPFGLFNSLNEGGSTDLDDYLASGNEVGLTRIESLFNELR